LYPLHLRTQGKKREATKQVYCTEVYNLHSNHVVASNYIIDVTKKNLIARIAFCQFSIRSDFHIIIRYFNKIYHFILLIIGEIYKNLLSKAIINSSLLAVRVIRKYTERMLHNCINPSNAELNPICSLLALLAHHFLQVSRIRVKPLTLRLLMSYIYGAPILDVSGSHTTMQHSR